MKKTFRLPIYTVIIAGLLHSCSENKTTVHIPDETEVNVQQTSMSITKTAFGKTPEGKTADLYTLVNKKGATAKITNYGGIITSLTMPDINGVYEDVVLGYDSLTDYIEDSPYFGALIGRYGNRIAKGKFELDGKRYSLPVNNGPNSLHGGDKGFDKVLWKATPIETDDAVGLKLTYESRDGEQGYPGDLSVKVEYNLGNDNTLKIDYKATTDQKTIVNLTQHSYFNLSGNTKTSILDHVLTIHADAFIPVDENLIPLGSLEDVSGTPFDFREPTVIGKRINDESAQLKNGNGYDHCWVLNAANSGSRLVAKLENPKSGRVMEVYTVEPGLQFYSGNFLDGSLIGKYNTIYEKYYGLALETQHYPDSPNQPDFPSVVLNPGDVYSTSTTYKFSTKE